MFWKLSEFRDNGNDPRDPEEAGHMRATESPECLPGRKKYECDDQETIFDAMGDTQYYSNILLNSSRL